MSRFMTSAASSSSGRTEQLATASEFAFYIESSVVPPANTCASDGSYTDAFRLSAMNLGWNIISKKRTAEWLCTAMEDAIQARDLNALGLSEIFEIDDNSEAPPWKYAGLA